MKVTAAVITKNEEGHIRACLESLAWAEERLVLDGGSTDGTATICRSQSRVRFETRRFDDFPHQRNAALVLAAHDWVLFVDADERCTPELAAEITAMADAPDRAAYRVPRFNHILGKVMHHTGWYPDEQTRLLDRRVAHYDETVPVHEVVQLSQGQTGALSQHLIHFNYATLRQFWVKQVRYSDMEAAQLRTAGGVRLRSLLSMPVREFVRRYWTLQGYRDGGHGLLLSVLMAYFAFRRCQKCLR